MTLSCSAQTRMAQPRLPPAAFEDSERAAAEAEQNEEEQLLRRGKVSAFVLDEPQFRIQGLRVGIVDFLDSESPSINYFMPERADYLEILRCSADTVIESLDNSLEGVELGSATAVQESELFRQTDFWEKAEQNQSCVLISTGAAEKAFQDHLAASGSYRYLARSCVDPRRLIDTEKLSTRNCSRQVVASPVLPDYRNNRSRQLQEALDEADQARLKMEAVSRTLYYDVVDLNEALVLCEEREKRRVVSTRKKAAIQALIGMGVAFGANVGVATMVAGSSAKGIFESVWKERNGIAGTAGAVAGTLGDLTAQIEDYPLTCTEAKRIEDRIRLAEQELQDSHELYAEKVQFAATVEDKVDQVEAFESVDQDLEDDDV